MLVVLVVVTVVVVLEGSEVVRVRAGGRFEVVVTDGSVVATSVEAFGAIAAFVLELASDAGSPDAVGSSRRSEATAMRSSDRTRQAAAPTILTVRRVEVDESRRIGTE